MIDSYYGLYFREKLRRDEAEAKYQRLAQLYGQQQTIIITQNQLIHELRLGKCPATHTTVTYMMKPAEALEE